MKITIHQPNYHPYLGYFNKVLQSDVFIIYDTAQFVKDRFDNRNKIKSGDSWCWLTVPIKESDFKPIMEAKINNSIPWAKKHWKTIELNYKKTPYFNDYSDIFRKIYLKKYAYLSEISIEIIQAVLKILDYNGKIILSSKLDFDKTLNSTETLISLTKLVGGDHYLSGASGKKYLNESLFAKNGLILSYHHFNHPKYNQPGKEFIPNLSIVDLLFNEGNKSRLILTGKEHELK